MQKLAIHARQQEGSRILRRFSFGNQLQHLPLASGQRICWPVRFGAVRLTPRAICPGLDRSLLERPVELRESGRLRPDSSGRIPLRQLRALRGHTVPLHAA